MKVDVTGLSFRSSLGGSSNVANAQVLLRGLVEIQVLGACENTLGGKFSSCAIVTLCAQMSPQLLGIKLTSRIRRSEPFHGNANATSWQCQRHCGQHDGK